MKYNIFILLTSYLVSSTSPSLLPHVNINQFSGLWYEIARTYNYYEKNCVAATVEYKLQKDNSYKVHNRCFEHVIGGKLIEYKGTAKPVHKGNSMSQMYMTYYYIFTQEYKVIYLENDYSAAVVADEKMDKVWVMSRKPTISEKKLQNILAKLENSMDLKRLIYTPQDEKGRYK